MFCCEIDFTPLPSKGTGVERLHRKMHFYLNLCIIIKTLQIFQPKQDLPYCIMMYTIYHPINFAKGHVRCLQALTLSFLTL